MAMNVNGPYVLTAEPNVTPLIDVLLVLLIIFMVIVPVTPTGLQTLLPQTPRNIQPSPPSTLVVEILAGANGYIAYKLNQQNIIGIAQLRFELNRIYSLRAEKVMFVKGDPSLNFESIAEVIDLGHSVGIDHIGLITPRVNAG
jgi:biopolymer transport protein ExbD